jgi:acetyl-CoA carboxylase biotin carboxylase subunit
MTPELRDKMGKAAVAAAKSVNYEGAGTIEFLVDDDLNFYFLEMNTRLQVEHPITERVVGIDLVKDQIRIANGEPLCYRQEDMRQQGHAIECRISAEDPNQNFMPSPGLVRHISEPHGLGVRIDGYVHAGYEIPIYYDPMISKLIVWARTRESAIGRMKRALYEYKISGVKTSIKFLERIMNNPDFAAGIYNTGFIEKHYDELISKSNTSDLDGENMAIITAFIDYQEKINKLSEAIPQQHHNNSQWKNFGRKKGME